LIHRFRCQYSGVVPLRIRIIKHSVIAIVVLLSGLVFAAGALVIALTQTHPVWTGINGLLSEYTASFGGFILDEIAMYAVRFGYWITLSGWLGLAFLAIKHKRVPGLIVSLMAAGIGSGYLINQLLGGQDLALMSPFLTATTGLYLALAFFSYHTSRRFLFSLGLQLIGLGLCLFTGFSTIYLGQYAFTTVLTSILFGVGLTGIILAAAKAYWLVALKRIS
jgi:hypothetical protein